MSYSLLLRPLSRFVCGVLYDDRISLLTLLHEMSYINREPRLAIYYSWQTLVILSKKRGLMGISKLGAGEKGSSWRVYLHVYARDFISLVQKP